MTRETGREIIGSAINGDSIDCSYIISGTTLKLFVHRIGNNIEVVRTSNREQH